MLVQNTRAIIGALGSGQVGLDGAGRHQVRGRRREERLLLLRWWLVQRGILARPVEVGEGQHIGGSGRARLGVGCGRCAVLARRRPKREGG
jgi:hypothetical protein